MFRYLRLMLLVPMLGRFMLADTAPGNGGSATSTSGGQAGMTGGGNDGGQGQQQGQQSDQGQQGATFTPPTSQAELDRLIGDRLRREREKFADYDEVKRKAGEFDKVTEAQKSDLEKATERVTQAEAKATETERRAWRAEIALEKGLTPSQAKRLVGNTRDELATDADDLLKDLGRTPGQGGQGVSFDQGRQGGTPKAKPGDAGHAEAQRRYGKPAATNTT